MSSRFRKLSHSIWHCQYYIVWEPIATIDLTLVLPNLVSARIKEVASLVPILIDYFGPMVSKTATVRRFFSLPAAVLLSATGLVGP